MKINFNIIKNMWSIKYKKSSKLWIFLKHGFKQNVVYWFYNILTFFISYRWTKLLKLDFKDLEFDFF